MRRFAVAALSLAVAGLVHAEVPPPQDVPYAPGMMKVEVDATNLSQRIFRIKQTIPVQAGPLTLLFPRWVPGGHSPRNGLDDIAGLTFKANGRKLEWKRDTVEVGAFHGVHVAVAGRIGLADLLHREVAAFALGRGAAGQRLGRGGGQGDHQQDS